MPAFKYIRKSIAYVLPAFILLISCSSPNNNAESSSTTDTTRLEYKLKVINDKLIKDPENPALYAERALINNARGVLPAAINDMKQAVSLDSTNQDYYLLLGDFAFRGLQVKESVDAFRKCIAINPSNKEANLKFAELNLYLKAYPDALKYANDALKLDERQAKPYFIKGFVYKEMKDTARAISSFQTVVEIDPEHYEAYLELGRIFAERGNPLAVQYYDNALRVRPTSTEALYNRGLFLQQAGRLDQAEQDYQTILKIDKQYADAYFNLGYISLIYRNESEKSIGFFTDAIRLNQDYVEAYYNRGMAFKQTGNNEAAKKDFMKCLSIYPAYKLAQDRLKEMGVK
jgi:tetratricopeptide (TPR) repeat protein